MSTTREKKQFAPAKGRVKPVRRELFSEPYRGTSESDYSEKDIERAFQSGGFRGVMKLTNLKCTQAFRLISKFGLIQKRNSARNALAEAECERENLEYLKRVWGWIGGDRLVLKKSKLHKSGEIFSAGKANYTVRGNFRKYYLPTGSVRQYLIDHGVKWWVIGEREFPVSSVADKCYICVKEE